MIIVSHDRFFMDKIVDHLLVFRGEGEIKDFPGNYTQFRICRGLAQLAHKRQSLPAKKHGCMPM